MNCHAIQTIVPIKKTVSCLIDLTLFRGSPADLPVNHVLFVMFIAIASLGAFLHSEAFDSTITTVLVPSETVSIYVKDVSGKKATIAFVSVIPYISSTCFLFFILLRLQGNQNRFYKTLFAFFGLTTLLTLIYVTVFALFTVPTLLIYQYAEASPHPVFMMFSGISLLVLAISSLVWYLGAVGRVLSLGINKKTWVGVVSILLIFIVSGLFEDLTLNLLDDIL